MSYLKDLYHDMKDAIVILLVAGIIIALLI